MIAVLARNQAEAHAYITEHELRHARFVADDSQLHGWTPDKVIELPGFAGNPVRHAINGALQWLKVDREVIAGEFRVNGGGMSVESIPLEPYDGYARHEVAPEGEPADRPDLRGPNVVALGGPNAPTSTTIHDINDKVARSADIRRWARANGFDVSTAGRIPNEAIDAYWEAHAPKDDDGG